LIRIFTPSFADESNTNAQNLTVKEIVARLRPDRFHVTMLVNRPPDRRIVERENVRLLRWHKHGNTLLLLLHCLRWQPDIYFYPKEGPLDAGFLFLRRLLNLRTAVVTHVVKCLDQLQAEDRRTLAARTLSASIVEADAVFGNSSYVTETIKAYYGVEAEAIHNGVDRRFFFPPDETAEHQKTREGNLTVLYAGSFQARKRVNMVVDQAARWSNVNFRLAGDGEEKEACRVLAERLGSQNVSFLGHVSLSKLGEEMRQADVFLFPSVIEGHPQVLGQAAACGLPSVAMNVYQPDYVVDGQTGFLADTDEELDQKLDLLLTDPDLRRSMSDAAVAHAQQFDWDRIARQWQDVFEEVVKRRREA